MTPHVATFNYIPESRMAKPLKDIYSYIHACLAKNNEKLWELGNRGSPLIYGNRCDMAHGTAFVMNLMAIASTRKVKFFQHCKNH